MQLPMAIVIGLLFAGGTYMILRPNLIRIVIGFGLYSNAANLLLITSGGYAPELAPPFVGKEPIAASAAAQRYMDPLPPDIVLTAIVISFAVGALLLTMAYCVYQDHGTDDPEQLKRQAEQEPEPPHPAGGRYDLGELFTESNGERIEPIRHQHDSVAHAT